MGTPQINLYYTDEVSEAKYDYAVQHTCLRVPTYGEFRKVSRGMISYCMNEFSPIFDVDNSNSFPNFTFDELLKQNITSEQLYLWSAPIDLIEDYQFYLNQLSTSNNLSLAKEVFYNCTIPRFGPKCQYELDYNGLNYSYIDTFYNSGDSPLRKVITYIYGFHGYKPIELTCYTHLQCNRNLFLSCLDWTDICNGKIDCSDGGQDEEHCWKLEIHECKDNEYRCDNEQCVSNSFLGDDPFIPDCIDGSDVKVTMQGDTRKSCHQRFEPSIECEDTICNDGLLTSSCVQEYENLLWKAMFSIEDNSVSKNCSLAFKCLLHSSDLPNLSCNNFCKQDECIKIINSTCPDMVYIPNIPVLFTDIYFVFINNDLHYLDSKLVMLFYICYQNSDYDQYFVNASKVLYNNMACIYSQQFLFEPQPWLNPVKSLYQNQLFTLNGALKRYHLIYNYTSEICNRSIMYQCIHSAKCIPIHRLMNGIPDCPHMDDENITVINQTDKIERIKNTFFKCPTSGKYISPSLVNNKQCDCDESHKNGWCDDEFFSMVTYIQTNILFQHICDGFIDLLPIMTDGQNETDETECEQWKCNNIYTYYNGIWNCRNGEDELGYKKSAILNCSSQQHECVSIRSNQLICLSVDQTNDGKVDCVGAIDEPTLCGTKLWFTNSRSSYDFYCTDQNSEPCISTDKLCDGNSSCQHGDDEKFCNKNRTSTYQGSICHWLYFGSRSDVEKFLCGYKLPYKTWSVTDFTLDKRRGTNIDPVYDKKNAITQTLPMTQLSTQYPSRCHRGLNLLVWLNSIHNSTTACLCPPSYYGDKCQYQNQRVSLIIQFRTLSNSLKILFAIVISLIEDSNERIIHSYEQFTYVTIRDCEIKFYIYLLYSNRSKDLMKNYSIHIDIYEKDSLGYRGSLLFPITFSFLPVHRLAFIVHIPGNNDSTKHCLNNQCIHGQCIKYSNNPQISSFCRCKQGWSGKYCTIPHKSKCTCSSDSLCIGIAANNRSICVCPINKFGSRCLLINSVCLNNDNSTCMNGGKCIPNDDDYMDFKQKFTCICSNGYRGERCELEEKKLILSFDKDIVLSQSITSHFIEIKELPLYAQSSTINVPNRGTAFKTISNAENSIIIYWSQPFNLVFIELSEKNYYLAVLQKIYNESIPINQMIKPSDRCPHISEVFNTSFAKLHLIRRIKYYHLPCQKSSLNLSCFYDDVHFCICYYFNQQRMANCFRFDHNMKFDCYGQSECEHGAQCVQDRPDCPKRSICKCQSCYYGKLCQFSTSGFGLSLDAILGYHISPYLSITQQSTIVQISLALTIIFIIAGLINGILSLITFKNKIVREVGCGIYLLGSSITTLLTTIMFGIKFLILLLSQMTIISNRSFLSFQCYSFDFILRICLHMDQWLNACVALERAITAIKDIGFNKKQSKRTAKRVIIILLLVIVVTSIHDPIYRNLIDEKNDDDNEKRIWCIVRYSFHLEVYNYIMHICHFFGPFIINLVSTVVLIKKKSRQQATVQANHSFKHLLGEQFRQHKHLIIAPIILVILAIPRLIISFVSKCMKSSNDAWLYLIGYFISFIPPMLTFVIFILPSKFYKKEFSKTIVQYRTNIRRRLNLIK